VYGHPEGVGVALVPNSFALQDLLIPALAPKAQAAARHARAISPPTDGLALLVLPLKDLTVAARRAPVGKRSGIGGVLASAAPADLVGKVIEGVLRMMQLAAVARRHAILLALLVTRAITVFARHAQVDIHGCQAAGGAEGMTQHALLDTVRRMIMTYAGGVGVARTLTNALGSPVAGRRHAPMGKTSTRATVRQGGPAVETTLCVRQRRVRRRIQRSLRHRIRRMNQRARRGVKATLANGARNAALIFALYAPRVSSRMSSRIAIRGVCIRLNHGTRNAPMPTSVAVATGASSVRGVRAVC